MIRGHGRVLDGAGAKRRAVGMPVTPQFASMRNGSDTDGKSFKVRLTRWVITVMDDIETILPLRHASQNAIHAQKTSVAKIDCRNIVAVIKPNYIFT